jgi:pyruvate dehydrogenase E1 component beta subunit
MGQDIAEYGGVFKITEGFVEQFGKARVRNTPLCESAIVGAALGLSIQGWKSVVEMQFADFVTCAFNQIINNLAKIHYRWGQNADVVIRMPTGAGVGAGPFHSQSNEAWFAHTPGLKVVYPSNPYDAKGLLKSSIRDNDPVIFMESELMYGDKGEVPEEEYLLELGKAHIVKEGSNVTLISFGKMMKVALEAAEEAAKEGISCEVIDLRTVRPIDYATLITSVKKTNRAVIVEEAWPLSSIATDLTFHIQRQAFDYLDAPILRVNNMDVPLPYAPTLIDAVLPNVKRTLDAIKQVAYVS